MLDCVCASRGSRFYRVSWIDGNQARNGNIIGQRRWLSVEVLKCRAGYSLSVMGYLEERLAQAVASGFLLFSR